MYSVWKLERLKINSNVDDEKVHVLNYCDYKIGENAFE